ncbi:MAG: hypothetical protein WA384_03865 [Rhodomicrobium sp.]
MMNPWLEIPLKDYEAHVSLPEVAQAACLADTLDRLVRDHAPESVAVIKAFQEALLDLR